MSRLIPMLFGINVLHVVCLFLYVQNNESYADTNQSAHAVIAVTAKNKYYLTIASDTGEITTVKSTHAILDSNNSKHHSNLKLLKSKRVRNKNDSIYMKSDKKVIVTRFDENIRKNVVHTLPNIKRNLFSTDVHPVTTQQMRTIKRATHDSNEILHETSALTVAKQNVFQNETIIDAEQPYRLQNGNTLYGCSGINNYSVNAMNSFHLFTELYDHFYWNITTIKHELGYDCAVEMDIYLEQLRNSMMWAMKASDSSGRYGGQTFFGNDFWLGSKSFCAEINLQNKENTQLKNEDFVEMHFFVATINIAVSSIIPEPKLLQLGQCLPSHCSTNDVSRILNEDPKSKLILNRNACHAKKNFRDVIEIIDVRTVPGSYSLLSDSKFFLISFIIVVLIVVMIFGTMYEIWHNKTEKTIVLNTLASEHSTRVDNTINDEMIIDISNTKKKLNNLSKNTTNDCVKIEEKDILNLKTQARKYADFSTDILLCFAAGSNSKTILSVAAANKDSLTCIHGLRLYSLLWTIMVHTYLQLFAVGENRYGRNITERSFTYQIIGNATFSVDTFFFISGLLVVVLFYRSTKKNGGTGMVNGKYVYENGIRTATSKIMLSIFYRFLRLTPAYLFVIIINELALKWTYGRSVFKPGIIDHITCDKFWWRNILYINNWYPVREMCMIWSWYLANDMQFYIVAIIVLTLSLRFMKTSIILLVLLTICSWITSIFISIHYNYSYKVANPFESFDILYDKPWQRITPYIMGMLTGYIYNFKKTPPKIPFYVNVLLWFFSLTIIVSLIFGVWKGQLSVPATALYMSIGHTAWGIALVWITLSCCWGNACHVNRLLSYRALYPLSRLSYCAYLLHPVVMMVTSFQMESPIHLQHIIVIPIFFGNAVISFILAYFVSLLLEAPMVNLLKLLFKK